MGERELSSAAETEKDKNVSEIKEFSNSKKCINNLTKMTQSRRQSPRKSKRNLVIKIPTAGRQNQIENKIFPKATSGLIKRLEGIREDADNTEDNANNKDDLCVLPAINNEVTNENNNKAHFDIKSHGSFKQKEDRSSEKQSTGKETKSFPKPLTRSNTDISISSKKSENKEGLDTVRNTFSRSNTELSLATTQSDITLPLTDQSKPAVQKLKRPKTVAGWTKKELEIFLPRKTFFSTHDNTLSQAGIDVRSDEERKRPEWRKFLRMRTQDELYPPEPKKEEPAPPVLHGGLVDSDDDEDEEFSLENIATILSGEGKEGGPTKRKWRLNAKKVLANDREEYKQLYDYLKYIHDNPDEYVQMAKYSIKNMDHRHPDRLVRMGRAFRRGHHGAFRNNMYLHAISGLKLACPEATNPKPGRNDKNVTKKEASDSHDSGGNSEETEIEKLKSKAEKWARGLSTQQFLKAKELALQEIGEEDVYITKWWQAFKSCHYIRVPIWPDNSS